MAETVNPQPVVKHSRWTTKRLFLSVLSLGLGTWALWYGKLDGENWVFLAFGCMAGHNLEDIIKAWRK